MPKRPAPKQNAPKPKTPARAPRARQRPGGDVRAPRRARNQTAPAAQNTELSAGTSSEMPLVYSDSEILAVVPGGAGNYDYPIIAGSGYLPILSNKVSGYGNYEFLECTLEYTTSVGTSVNGYAFLSYAPDINYPKPTTDAEFAALKPYVTGAIWSNHSIDLMPTIRRMAGTRTRIVNDPDAVAQPNAVEDNLYGFGRAFLSITSSEAGTPSGRLWLRYKIRATNPRMPMLPSQASGFVHATVGVTKALPFGTAPHHVVPGHVHPTTPTGHLTVRRPGFYRCNMLVRGTAFTDGATVVRPTATAPPGASGWVAPDFLKDGSDGNPNWGGSPANWSACHRYIRIHSPTSFDFGPCLASAYAGSGTATVTHVRISIDPFSHDTWGLLPDVDAADEDFEEV